MKRCRFKANLEDSRPVKFPPPYPWWESGFNDEHSIVIAYADSEEQIMEYWPEATDIESEEVTEIVYSSRFPTPDWYNPTNSQGE